MTRTQLAVALLVASHLLAAAAGAAGGYAYDVHVGARLDSLNQMIVRLPQHTAAELAFRFGTPEHARALLTELPISETNDLFQWGDVLMRDLRLAVIFKEVGDASGEVGALASAAAACRRLGRTSCTPADLNKAATIVGRRRTR